MLMFFFFRMYVGMFCFVLLCMCMCLSIGCTRPVVRFLEYSHSSALGSAFRFCFTFSVNLELLRTLLSVNLVFDTVHTVKLCKTQLTVVTLNALVFECTNIRCISCIIYMMKWMRNIHFIIRIWMKNKEA